MCAYVNSHWAKSALHLSAYVMWRLNWIHPFAGGNGRTSRAASYLVLCVLLGERLIGERLKGAVTIPEYIERDRQPYYEALDAADLAWSKGVIDVSVMEKLLDNLLAAQLVSIYEKASTSDHPAAGP
jgi:Fic family protein